MPCCELKFPNLKDKVQWCGNSPVYSVSSKPGHFWQRKGVSWTISGAGRCPAACPGKLGNCDVVSPCPYGTSSNHTRNITAPPTPAPHPMLYSQVLGLILRYSTPQPWDWKALPCGLGAKVYQLRQLWMPEQMTPATQGLTQRSWFLAKTNGDVWWTSSMADLEPGLLPLVVPHHLPEPWSPLFSARRKREGGTTNSQTLWLGGDPYHLLSRALDGLSHHSATRLYSTCGFCPWPLYLYPPASQVSPDGTEKSGWAYYMFPGQCWG